MMAAVVAGIVDVQILVFFVAILKDLPLPFPHNRILLHTVQRVFPVGQVESPAPFPLDIPVRRRLAAAADTAYSGAGPDNSFADTSRAKNSPADSAVT